MRKWLVWEGDLNKKKTFWTVGHEMNSWKTQKNNKKREDRLILTLHPALLLQYSPICHFYFPGSPLCFSSRRLHLCFPSPLRPHPPVSKQAINWTDHTWNNNRDPLGVFTCVFTGRFNVYSQILPPKLKFIHLSVDLTGGFPLKWRFLLLKTRSC